LRSGLEWGDWAPDLAEVVQGEGVALVCGEGEVVERLVEGLLDAHAGDVHGSKVELRVRWGEYEDLGV
jgi:hypothetical protein